MESCPTQAVLPLVGLAAKKVIRDRWKLIAGGHSVEIAAPTVRSGVAHAGLSHDGTHNASLKPANRQNE
ncbi:MAG: hypothetical protein ACODAD_05725 [Planctomycetota bacterium]